MVRIRLRRASYHNINENMLSRYKREGQSLRYLPNTNTTDFQANSHLLFHFIFDNGRKWTTSLENFFFDFSYYLKINIHPLVVLEYKKKNKLK